MTIIKPELRDKIYYFLIIALSMVMPIHDKLVPPVIALICINWLLEMNFREKYRRIQNSIENKYLSAFGLLYVLYIIGAFYSSELKGKSGAFFDLEVKLSLLLFPLLFATIDFSKIKTDLFKKVLYFFVLGCMMNSIFIFNNAVMQYFIDAANISVLLFQPVNDLSPKLPCTILLVCSNDNNGLDTKKQRIHFQKGHSYHNDFTFSRIYCVIKF